MAADCRDHIEPFADQHIVIKFRLNGGRRCAGQNLSVAPLFKERVVLNRILLISAIVGIILAHGVVLYKIDTGVRAAGASQVMPSGSRRAAYW